MWDNVEKENVTVGEYKTIQQMVDLAKKDLAFYEESGGGVTLSGGEALFQADFAILLLAALKKENIHTVCETCGYGNHDSFKKLIQYTDLIYFDLKHYNDEEHRRGTGVSLHIILENLDVATKLHPNVVVRIPIIPSYNDSPEDALAFARLLRGKRIEYVELLPFHQFGESKYKALRMEYSMAGIPQLHDEDLQRFKEILSSQGITVKA